LAFLEKYQGQVFKANLIPPRKEGQVNLHQRSNQEEFNNLKNNFE